MCGIDGEGHARIPGQLPALNHHLRRHPSPLTVGEPEPEPSPSEMEDMNRASAQTVSERNREPGRLQERCDMSDPPGVERLAARARTSGRKCGSNIRTGRGGGRWLSRAGWCAAGGGGVRGSQLSRYLSSGLRPGSAKEPTARSWTRVKPGTWFTDETGYLFDTLAAKNVPPAVSEASEDGPLSQRRGRTIGCPLSMGDRLVSPSSKRPRSLLAKRTNQRSTPRSTPSLRQRCEPRWSRCSRAPPPRPE